MLECYDTLLAEQFPAFYRITVPSTSGQNIPKRLLYPDNESITTLQNVGNYSQQKLYYFQKVCVYYIHVPLI
jgi:hypothetical protein